MLCMREAKIYGYYSSRIVSKRRSRASRALSRESHFTGTFCQQTIACCNIIKCTDKDDIFEREKHQENCIKVRHHITFTSY